MKIFKTKKQKLIEECWNLDNELIKWLNEHLKCYLETASNVIDLDFYKHNYRGKEYTEKEIVLILIDITNYLMNDEFDSYDYDLMTKHYKQVDSMKNKMYDLLKLVHWELNW